VNQKLGTKPKLKQEKIEDGLSQRINKNIAKPKLKQEKIEDGLSQRINKNIAFMDVQAVVAGI